MSEILEKSSNVIKCLFEWTISCYLLCKKNFFYSSFLLEFWTPPLTPHCSISVIGVTQTGGNLRSYLCLACSFLLFPYIIIFKFPPPQWLLNLSSITLPIHPHTGPYYFLPRLLPLLPTWPDRPTSISKIHYPELHPACWYCCIQIWPCQYPCKNPSVSFHFCNIYPVFLFSPTQI